MRKKYIQKKVFFQLKVTYGRKSGVNLELNRKPVALNPTLRQMNELTETDRCKSKLTCFVMC